MPDIFFGLRKVEAGCRSSADGGTHPFDRGPTDMLLLRPAPFSLSLQILPSTRCSCLLTLTDLARQLVLSSPPFERSVR